MTELRIADEEKGMVAKKPFLARYWRDICVALAMCVLMFIGSGWQLFTQSNFQYFNVYSDVAKYQCYTVGFWQGMPTVQTKFTKEQCGFMRNKPATNGQIADFMREHGFPQPLIDMVKSQQVGSRFHVLPNEYPFSTLIFFSLALLAPARFFQLAYAFWMAVLAVILYVLLARYKSRRAAMVYAVYMVAGAAVTALARFDLLPAAATLFAVICAVRRRWTWAYIWLAVATLLKFYPAVLLMPFLLAQQMELGKQVKWYAWRRWKALAVFVVLCVVVMAVSLFLSIEGTVGQFTYFGQRPMQVEAVGASLMWLISKVTGMTLTYGKTFGSLNILNHLRLMSIVSIGLNVLLFVGLLYTYWLQWKGRINVAASSLLTLLVVMVTGKVFSPQYLIWVAPLVAFVGDSDRKWFIPWTMISVLTSIVYPIIYNQVPLVKVPLQPAFWPVVTIRNLLLFGFVVWLLVLYTRSRKVGQADVEAQKESALT
ncbi:uncharacterized protein DUF2029 [Thermosporothrix hazakensis]|jgi:MFS family permease|uniref:Uncharacterized protein DUF2029 n=2 Tax=Thermosporothrix TaxID=768650 RepID=A0A326TYN8_THEHA|nr:glycosyltransferase family 87 protein [Thermosporothrix hazakensis]PZW22470.1 uncharacterized protein DUF2029 [Thermosporothrix hazakensis]BBH86049.1 hypothetical protein KTC_08000 [Thermosporothrix sp. COM3]GCE45527.1 hypothetical protein KTH_03960 [Thermosporothrix hazakensis]